LNSLAEGQYVAEAVRELDYRLRLLRYSGNMIAILAGSTVDMDYLMTVKPTLSSLSHEEIIFQNLKPEECLTLLERELTENSIRAPVLRDTSSITYIILYDLVKFLSEFPSWGNARGVKSLAMHMRASVVKATLSGLENGSIPSAWREEQVGNTKQYIGTLSAEQAVSCMKEMVDVQVARHTSAEKRSSPVIVDCARTKSPPLRRAEAPIITRNLAQDRTKTHRP
jgi:hypothetical protein